MSTQTATEPDLAESWECALPVATLDLVRTDMPPEGNDLLKTPRIAEPLEIGAIIESEAQNLSPEAFIERWENEYRCDSLNTNKPGVCRYCAGEIPRPWVITLPESSMIVPLTSCQSCVDAGKARIADEQAEAARNRFASWCPPEFNQPWNQSLGNNALRDKVVNQYVIADRKNVVVNGISGQTKTRCMWELLKHLIENDETFRDFQFLDAYEISINGFPKIAYTASYVVLDDIGNDSITGKNEKALLHLLKVRIDWRRPTFITTQLSPAQFRQRFFSGATADALMNRMRTRSTFITA